MKLRKLQMKNFMPYFGESLIEFPTDDFRNVMIIFGDNMRGKTSLLNAIRWGFYGRAMGRHSRPIALHDLVNKDATLVDDWSIETRIEFDANGNEYDLRRSATRKPYVVTPTKPEDFNISIQLKRNGSLLSGNEVEQEINQFAPEQISRFFLFDGELLQEYESLLIEGSDQGRQIKEAIEQVLGVPSLMHGREELGAILKSATKKQSNDLAHVQGLEKQAERQKELTTRQDALDRDLRNLQAKYSDTKSDRDKLDDELENAAAVLGKKGKLDILLEQKAALTERVERLRLERKQLISQAWQDMLDASLSVKRAQLTRRQAEMAAYLKQQGSLQAQIANFDKLLRTNECPTCGQSMSTDRREAIGAELGKLEAELNNYSQGTQEIELVSGQLASLNKIRGANIADRLTKLDKEAKIASVELQRSENTIEEINEEISGYDTADLARKRSQQQEKLKEEGRLQSQIAAVRKDIEKIRDDLAIIARAIEGLAPARSQKSTLKVSLARDLERVFSTSIERLRDQLRASVETRANEAFKSMSTQKAYRGLEINANYGLSILDTDGRKIPIRSAGAEQVVALSLIDGLNRTGRAIGPVVMDTPFGRLDLLHRDNILNYLPTVTSQFILLVHSGEIRPETDLATIRPRIGEVYSIREISTTCSKVERTSL